MSWNIDAKLGNLERELEDLREKSAVRNNELIIQLAFIQNQQINIQLQIWFGLVLLVLIFIILTWRFWATVLAWLGVAVPIFFSTLSLVTGLRWETVIFGLIAICGLIFMCFEWWKDSPAKAYLSNSEKPRGQEPSKVVDALRKSLDPYREGNTQGYSQNMELYRQEAEHFLDKTKLK